MVSVQLDTCSRLCRNVRPSPPALRQKHTSHLTHSCNIIWSSPYTQFALCTCSPLHTCRKLCNVHTHNSKSHMSPTVTSRAIMLFSSFHQLNFVHSYTLSHVHISIFHCQHIQALHKWRTVEQFLTLGHCRLHTLYTFTLHTHTLSTLRAHPAHFTHSA